MSANQYQLFLCDITLLWYSFIYVNDRINYAIPSIHIIYFTTRNFTNLSV